MNKKRIIGSLVALCLCMASFAQEEYYMTGLPLDDGTYDQLERKAVYATKGADAPLPKQHSLLEYCPIAKSQGQHGTCTSWASVYAARTIAEAVRHGWTSRETITEEAFSPLFVYAQTKKTDDFACSQGIHIWQALNLMKEQGCAKYRDFNVLCAEGTEVGKSLQEAASQYKIDDYLPLIKKDYDAQKKEEMVKKSLVENKPVVIAMWLPSSFSDAGRILNMNREPASFPRTNYYNHDPYHAMCVVGYDDNMAGGAFQIMNSWGNHWRNDGFVWVKYADFARCVDQAYEVTVNPLPKPVPEPEPIALSGRFKIQLTHDAVQKTNPNTILKVRLDDAGHYVIQKTFYESDQFRLYVSNGEEAYVYVIGSDMKRSDVLLFPNENVSARLGNSYAIALPSETASITMDETKGTDYWCVLYSIEELDIQETMRKMEAASGSFHDRVKTALGDKMVPKDDVRFVMNRIEFSARSEKTVVPVIIEAKHK
ncbi:MAG: hypothetical protein IJP44_00645 [Bacteroidales bacterium]|nr:hypothetical protein [Bacteroidales bacterium]